MGIAGDNSWGALTHEEYLLPHDEKLNFSFSFKGIDEF
jgi:beta-galactosidase